MLFVVLLADLDCLVDLVDLLLENMEAGAEEELKGRLVSLAESVRLRGVGIDSDPIEAGMAVDDEPSESLPSGEEDGAMGGLDLEDEGDAALCRLIVAAAAAASASLRTKFDLILLLVRNEGLAGESRPRSLMSLMREMLSVGVKPVEARRARNLSPTVKEEEEGEDIATSAMGTVDVEASRAGKSEPSKEMPRPQTPDCIGIPAPVPSKDTCCSRTMGTDRGERARGARGATNSIASKCKS